MIDPLLVIRAIPTRTIFIASDDERAAWTHVSAVT